MKYLLSSVCLVVSISIFAFSSCSPNLSSNTTKLLQTSPSQSAYGSSQASQPTSETESTPVDVVSENIVETSYVTLTAVGDNILHNTVIASAKVGDTYNFAPMYQYVAEYIQSADIAVINQESPLGGSDYTPSGYPRFNSPQVLGDQLVEVGFNVINHANNHAMDKGAGAVYDTVDFWDTYKDDGILMTGMYRDSQDREELRIMDKNGISIGFLSYTYSTNGIPLPSNNPDIVSLIDDQRIAYDMNRLVPACDIVVVIMHWGNEYSTTPSDEQIRLAEYLTELGAGIIIGHHPHVVQPACYIDADNGNRSFCAYSLGNFLSSQDKIDRLIEGMLTLTIKKEGNLVSVESPYITPLINYYDSSCKTYRIYPLSQYSAKIASSHRFSSLTPQYATKFVTNIFGDYLSLQ